MAKVEVILPQMGEGIIEATITRWLSKNNTHVEEDEPILEIATDKVDSEIPAPVTGMLIKQFFSEGEIPKIGDVVAIIDDGNDDEPSDDVLDGVKQGKEELWSNKSFATEKKIGAKEKLATEIKRNKFSQNISLFIRNFSRARGITSNELGQIIGTGENGKIVKADIYNYINSGRPFRSATLATDGYDYAESNLPEEYVAKKDEEIIEMDRTRVLIAERMLKSVQVAPHVTSFIEVDITALVDWRESVKEEFRIVNGFNLTYTPILTDVVVKALKDFSGINVSLLPKNKLLKKKYINIGIATALPDGNLIVPVVKNADQMNLFKLASEIADKTLRARKGVLKPGETNGGTFTITNLGQVENISGTPIINQPESAILAVGAIVKKPGVVKSQGVYAIGVRDIITLSLSYDHRIIDGGLGGAFLNRIGKLLEAYKPELSA